MDKQLYVVHQYPTQSIWLPDGKNLKLHTEVDFSAAIERNKQLQSDNGKGITESGECKEEFQAPYDLIMNDPDGREWFYTRSKKAKQKFLAKYPWVRTSTGNI